MFKGFKSEEKNVVIHPLSLKVGIKRQIKKQKVGCLKRKERLSLPGVGYLPGSSGDFDLGDLGDLEDLGDLNDLPGVGDIVKDIPIVSSVFDQVCSDSKENKLQGYVTKYSKIVDDASIELLAIKKKFINDCDVVREKLDAYITVLKLSLANCQ